MSSFVKITNKDILFDTKYSQDENSLACYGWVGNGYGAFYNYYLGYKHSLEISYKEFKRAKTEREIEILDTLVYPICFTLRHMTELFIKYLYLKYAPSNQEEKINFLKNNHDIKKAWDELKLIIEKILEDQSCWLDISIIDRYINQINSFDKSSMKMRYPCDKKLLAMNDKNERLNLIYLIEHMLSFFNLFEKLDRAIDGNLFFWEEKETDMNLVENKLFNIVNEIKNFIKIIEVDVNNNDVLSENVTNYFIDITDIPYNRTPWFEEPMAKFLLKLDEDKCTAVVLLYYSIRDIKQKRCIISKIYPFKDLQKLILSNIRELSLTFDATLDNLADHIEKISGTTPTLVLDIFNTGLKIIEEELNKEKNNG